MKKFNRAYKLLKKAAPDKNDPNPSETNKQNIKLCGTLESNDSEKPTCKSKWQQSDLRQEKSYASTSGFVEVSPTKIKQHYKKGFLLDYSDVNPSLPGSSDIAVNSYDSKPAFIQPEEAHEMSNVTDCEDTTIIIKPSTNKDNFHTSPSVLNINGGQVGNDEMGAGACEESENKHIAEDTVGEFSGNLMCLETLQGSDDDRTICEDEVALSDDFLENVSSEITNDRNGAKEINNLLKNDVQSNNPVKRLKKTDASKRFLVDYSASDEDYCSSDDSVCDPTFQLPPENHQSDIITDSDEDQENEVQVKTPTRWRKKDPSQWKVNISKYKRSQCLPYNNKIKECSAKLPRDVNCTRCRYDCSSNFTEEDRSKICHTYWAMADNKRQKDFLIKSVTTVTPKRRKVDENSPNARAISKAYYLKNDKGRFRVCANFFQKTLCISNGPIDTAIQGADSMGVFQGVDKRGRKVPGNKTKEDQLTLIKQHIESFPAMESHYVRQSSKKKYLDCKLSILKMYEMYKEFCKEKEVHPVSEFTYRKVFCTDYNLSFFKPKKDQCSICKKYETADVAKKSELEIDYTMHIIRKNECNSAKESDKQRCLNDPSFLTTNFDLQSVLQLPYSDVSQFYYSRKLCVYNLTLYEGEGKNAYCYCWNELNGKRGSNEIGSILLKYINQLPAGIEEISLFSDTCGGQNRNQQVAAALLYAVTHSHLKVIHHKFLESGHSHMECDSMHSAIENAKRNKTAYMMHDWLQIFKSARSNRNLKKRMEKDPYQVVEMKYPDFIDLQSLASSTIKNRNKDMDGNTVSWLKIKCLKFDQDYPDSIFYRYDHSSEYREISVVGRGRRRCNQPLLLKSIYTQLLPITKQKREDLQKLCRGGLIPDELHSWYSNLPITNETAIERLPEPNASEDENETE